MGLCEFPFPVRSEPDLGERPPLGGEELRGVEGHVGGRELAFCHL